MRTAPSATLARHWVPERSLVSDARLIIASSLFTGLMDAINLAAAAVVLPAGWRLSRSR